jgi:hypothetical protein
MLTISEATWQQLLDEAQAAIDRQNARCVGDYANYSHELKIEEVDDGDIVLASAIQRKPNNYGQEFDHRKINRLAWRKSDGAVLKVTLKRKGKRIETWIKTITAKNWAQAAAKSPKHLLNVSGLVDFIMIGKAYVSHVETFGGVPQPEPAAPIEKPKNYLELARYAAQKGWSTPKPEPAASEHPKGDLFEGQDR